MVLSDLWVSIIFIVLFVFFIWLFTYESKHDDAPSDSHKNDSDKEEEKSFHHYWWM